MPNAYHPRPPLRMALIILLIAIALDRWCISLVLPDISGFISINPMPVFLDIPMDLSLGFGLLPVTGLFLLLYCTCCGSRPGCWNVLGMLLSIPLWTLAGGLLYDVLQPQIPKHIRQAIESFGLNIDVHTALPGHGRIHLCGSMIMFAAFLIALHAGGRKIKRLTPHAQKTIPVMEPPHMCDQVEQSPAFAVNGMNN